MSRRIRNIIFKQFSLNANQHDSLEISDGVQNAYGPVLYFTINSFIICGGFIALYYAQTYFEMKQRFWLIIALCFGNHGVVIPMIMIYKYDPFKMYLKRQFNSTKDVIPWFSISPQVCCRRDRRVQNLDDETLP